MSEGGGPHEPESKLLIRRFYGDHAVFFYRARLYIRRFDNGPHGKDASGGGHSIQPVLVVHLEGLWGELNSHHKSEPVNLNLILINPTANL